MSDSTLSFHTFRARAGHMRMAGGVLRTKRPNLVVTTEAFVTPDLARELLESGCAIPANSAGIGKDGALDLEYRDIFFPSYPWEWCADQWIDAGVLTLDLCDRILDHGLILNSATPLNIQFHDGRPVLVEMLSIQPRDPENPTWDASAEFVRTFLLPLIAHKYLGWPLAAFRFRKDGFEPRELDSFLPFFRKWLGPARTFVTLPALFGRHGKSTRMAAPAKSSNDASVASIRLQLRSLRSAILSLRSGNERSRGSCKAENRHDYSKRDNICKAAFVKRALSSAKPATVLDLGAGTGSCSYLAASCGARVVAMDIDYRSTAIHYDKTRQISDPVQVIVADITQPTPSVGWKNQASLSLLDRCRGHFDCVLMLDLLHCLLASDRIPLGEIAALAADMAPRWLVVEWIPSSDEAFAELCQGKDALDPDLSEEGFLDAFASYFQVVEREKLLNGRVLFQMKAK